MTFTTHTVSIGYNKHANILPVSLVSLEAIVGILDQIGEDAHFGIELDNKFAVVIKDSDIAYSRSQAYAEAEFIHSAEERHLKPFIIDKKLLEITGGRLRLVTIADILSENPNNEFTGVDKSIVEIVDAKRDAVRFLNTWISKFAMSEDPADQARLKNLKDALTLLTN